MSGLIVLLMSMSQVLHSTEGTDCLHCIDFTANRSGIDAGFQSVIDGINMLNTSRCFDTNNTTLLRCKPALGYQKVQRCGIFKGTIILHQWSFHLNILTEITAQGCFEVDRRTKTGCYTDPFMLNEQKTNLANFLLKEIGHLKIQTFNVTDGQFCINQSFASGRIEKASNKSILATEESKNRSAMLKFKYCSILVFVIFMFSDF
ncbi:uncharacterized protein LOC134696520 isoform X2 [Mytilus trossulus]|uniref:uncharacterized protein LOC134696520 isoform X2 n=1 Tax=Mytilus trossulus TaxID=6551 RepID=UPI0030063F6C